MNRRKVLKAAGATSTLPFVSGVASGDEDKEEETETGQGQRQGECPRPKCIHPTLGYSGLSADEQLPSPLQPDHEVNLMLRPPAPDSDREIPEFFFEPTGLQVSQGDVVRYNLATPDHTVTAYHPGFGRQRRVPKGVPPFSSPVMAGGTFWLYRYDQAGVYDMLCAPHEVFGMVGRVVVGEASADWMESGDGTMNDTGEMNETGNTNTTENGTTTPTPTEDGSGQAGPQLRPPELTAALVFQDPALDPSNIRNEGSVSWDALSDESKQILVEFPEADGEQ